MPKRRYITEAIIHKMNAADVFPGQGETAGKVCKALGITDQSKRRWWKLCGRIMVNWAKRLKELEAENVRLERVFADLAADNLIP